MLLFLARTAGDEDGWRLRLLRPCGRPDIDPCRETDCSNGCWLNVTGASVVCSLADCCCACILFSWSCCMRIMCRRRFACASCSSSSFWWSSPRLGWRWRCGSIAPLSAIDRRPSLGLLLLLVCISPGPGKLSLSAKLVIKLDLRRSRTAGDPELDECRLALIVAAACRLDSDGDRGDGGPVLFVSPRLMDMRRSAAEGDRVGRLLMSGILAAASCA